MSYFLFKQPWRIDAKTTRIGEVKDTVIMHTVHNMSSFTNIDFIEDGCLVSDRMKKLIEMFLPHNEWVLYT